MTDTPTRKQVAQELALKYVADGITEGAKEIYAALTDAYERGQRDAVQWQPIETAPRDGVEILGCFEGHAKVLRWSDKRDKWSPHGFWTDGFMRLRYPSHWQPIPTPPNSEKEER